jgi:hypothetical protein
MKIEQNFWTISTGWNFSNDSEFSKNANLILVFGAIDEITNKHRFFEIKNQYPNANIVLCSTAGEIIGDRVENNLIVSNAIYYEKTNLEFVDLNIENFENSYSIGKEIAAQLPFKNLKHVLILSDGILVNGDELVDSLNKNLPNDVIITGGLAGDNGKFVKTYTGLNSPPKSGNIIAIGHYGDFIQVSHGSKGGWDEFGPTRTVTKSKGNELFELDGKNALELYKKYLGEKAKELPSSALLFPLCIYRDDGDNVVRTILSIDENKGSMIFAGDIPQNSTVRFMMANFEKLIHGAQVAAEESQNHAVIKSDSSLVLMISCIGRKLVLGQRIDEEVEAVIDVLGKKLNYTGFYSNGELSPLLKSTKCSLHNQTMTITMYSEK